MTISWQLHDIGKEGLKCLPKDKLYICWRGRNIIFRDFVVGAWCLSYFRQSWGICFFVWLRKIRCFRGISFCGFWDWTWTDRCRKILNMGCRKGFNFATKILDRLSNTWWKAALETEKFCFTLKNWTVDLYYGFILQKYFY